MIILLWLCGAICCNRIFLHIYFKILDFTKYFKFVSYIFVAILSIKAKSQFIFKFC